MEYKLKELLQEKGYIRGPFGSSLKRKELKTSGIPVYEQQHAIYGTRDFRYYIDNQKYQEMKRFAIQPKDLIISCSGTIGKVGIISQEDKKGIISQALLILRVNDKIVLPEYLYYFFKSKDGYNSIISRSMGSVQVNIAKREVIENIKINIPTLEQQRKVITFLSNIDRKIELNNQMNENLYDITKQLYKRWFVDFEFPNENGEPYKSEGGKFIDSELGKIPERWEVKELKEFFPVITGKKDANASDDKGKYPFFTCSQKISKISTYSFDDSAILLAGNGDFNVKFYRGKFDAYQRTYVLIPIDKRKLGFLYQTIKYNLKEITSGFRG